MSRLEIGANAPTFTLPDASGTEISLAYLLAKSSAGVIVYFYPRANTPGCTKEACDFRDSLASLQGAGYQVVGISPDRPEKLAAFAADHTLPFPLLSDPDHEVMEEWGAWGEKQNYGRTITGTIRSTVILDPAGKVTHALYNVKATGHVARLRKELGLD